MHVCTKAKNGGAANGAAVGTCFMHVRTKAKNGGAHIFIGRAQDPPLRLLEAIWRSDIHEASPYDFWTIWRSDMHEASPYDFWGIPTPPIIDARLSVQKPRMAVQQTVRL